MCFFPHINTDFTGEAYRAGVKEFDCGYCPECLQKRSRVWVVRAYYERLTSKCCQMLTLTYDHFARDKKGNVIRDRYGYPMEEPVVQREVIKKDVQDFLKRYRSWLDYKYGKGKKRIKFLASAEYGHRTQRAHYHLIIFGHIFEDRVKYKKSKRNNQIYMSDQLNKLWGHGICTIDAVNCGAKVVRYCTKYCAKERGSETFMLASQKLGLEGMLNNFNGLNYIIEGRRYPIPRVVWQEVIKRRYHGFGEDYDYRYTDRFDMKNKKLRKAYRELRNNDPQYMNYREYWQRRGEQLERMRLPVFHRINNLPDNKYFGYKQNALLALGWRQIGVAWPSLGSPVQRTELFRQWLQIYKNPAIFYSKPYLVQAVKTFFPEEYRAYMRMRRQKFRKIMDNYNDYPAYSNFISYKYSKCINNNNFKEVTCPKSSCHIRAGDRKIEVKTKQLEMKI